MVLQNRVTEEIPFDHLVNRTGDIWHIFLHRDDFKLEDMLYGYRLDGPYSPQDGHYFDASLVVLDPYAKVYSFASFIYVWCSFD